MMKKALWPVALVALFAFAALPSQAAGRWRLDFENGGAWAGYNDVQIPKSSGTRFSLTDDFEVDGAYYFRLRLSYQLHPRHSLSLLFAPLSLKASGVAASPLLFNGTEFPAAASARGVYRFNSYRLTYRYELVNNATWKVGVGFTAKIRDAGISLETDALSSEKTNVGFVPLLHFRAEWTLTPRLGLLLEADALAASQGRAEDVALTVLYRLWPRVSLKAGYRLVEGGANVEEVYNFALIHYAAAGLVVEF